MAQIKKYNRGAEITRLQELQGLVQDAYAAADEETKAKMEAVAGTYRNYKSAEPMHNRDARRLEIDKNERLLQIASGEKGYDPLNSDISTYNMFGYLSQPEVTTLGNQLTMATVNGVPMNGSDLGNGFFSFGNNSTEDPAASTAFKNHYYAKIADGLEKATRKQGNKNLRIHQFVDLLEKGIQSYLSSGSHTNEIVHGIGNNSVSSLQSIRSQLLSLKRLFDPQTNSAFDVNNFNRLTDVINALGIDGVSSQYQNWFDDLFSPSEEAGVVSNPGSDETTITELFNNEGYSDVTESDPLYNTIKNYLGKYYVKKKAGDNNYYVFNKTLDNNNQFSRVTDYAGEIIRDMNSDRQGQGIFVKDGILYVADPDDQSIKDIIGADVIQGAKNRAVAGNNYLVGFKPRGFNPQLYGEDFTKYLFSDDNDGNNGTTNGIFNIWDDDQELIDLSDYFNSDKQIYGIVSKSKLAQIAASHKGLSWDDLTHIMEFDPTTGKSVAYGQDQISALKSAYRFNGGMQSSDNRFPIRKAFEDTIALNENIGLDRHNSELENTVKKEKYWKDFGNNELEGTTVLLQTIINALFGDESAINKIGRKTSNGGWQFDISKNAGKSARIIASTYFGYDGNKIANLTELINNYLYNLNKLGRPLTEDMRQKLLALRQSQIQSNKEGGILKFYPGGNLKIVHPIETNSSESSDQSSFETYNSNNYKDVVKEIEREEFISAPAKDAWSDPAIQSRIAGLVLDAGALGVALTGGKNPYSLGASIALGLGSTGANVVADVYDPTMTKWDVAKNAATNAGLAVLGSVQPKKGATKLIKGIVSTIKSIPYMAGAVTAGGIAIDQIEKLASKDPVTYTKKDISDLLLLAQIVTGFGTAGVQRKTVKAYRPESSDVVKIKTKKGIVEVDPKVAKEMDQAGREKGQAAAEEVLKKAGLNEKLDESVYKYGTEKQAQDRNALNMLKRKKAEKSLAPKIEVEVSTKPSPGWETEKLYWEQLRQQQIDPNRWIKLRGRSNFEIANGLNGKGLITSNLGTGERPGWIKSAAIATAATVGLPLALPAALVYGGYKLVNGINPSFGENIVRTKKGTVYNSATHEVINVNGKEVVAKVTDNGSFAHSDSGKEYQKINGKWTESSKKEYSQFLKEEKNSKKRVQEIEKRTSDLEKTSSFVKSEAGFDIRADKKTGELFTITSSGYKEKVIKVKYSDSGFEKIEYVRESELPRLMESHPDIVDVTTGETTKGVTQISQVLNSKLLDHKPSDFIQSRKSSGEFNYELGNTKSKKKFTASELLDYFEAIGENRDVKTGGYVASNGKIIYQSKGGKLDKLTKYINKK